MLNLIIFCLFLDVPVAAVVLFARIACCVVTLKKDCCLNVFSSIHFSGESASLLVEKGQSGSESVSMGDDKIDDEQSGRLKSNHVSLLQRNERQFYDNLLVSRSDKYQLPI